MATADHHAANTRRAYRSDFAHFTRWCRAAGIPPLPATPEAVYLYLMDLVADDNSAGYAVATVERRLAAITAVHRGDGNPPTPAQHPQVRQLMAAIRRTYGRPPNGRDPLTGDQLAVIVDHLNLATPSDLRDRALLLFGFASGLRRAELAALTVEQLAPHDGGYLVTPRPADPAVLVRAQPGTPLCPVAAVDGWLAAAGIASGPVFRKVTRYQTVVARPLAPAAVALIVKRAAQAADLPADRLAAHSLPRRASLGHAGAGGQPAVTPDAAGPRRRRPTATSAYGVSRRESHDASAFYARFGAPDVSADDLVNAPKATDEIFVGDARAMDTCGDVADASVALVVTSPPYFVGKEYEQALGDGHIPATYQEYLIALEDVFAECVRKLEPGGRIAVNVANLGRKPYRSLSGDVTAILQDRLGLLIRGEIVWWKAHAAGGSCAWGTYQRPGNPVLRDLTERVVVASKGRFDRALSAADRARQGLPCEGSMSMDEFVDATTDIWDIPAESATPAWATQLRFPSSFPAA